MRPMKNSKLIIFFFIMAILALIPRNSFSKDAAVQKINLTWPSYFDPSSLKNKPRANIKLDPLRKVTYKCDGQTINFKDGKFQKAFKDYNLYVEFADGAYGDVNGDGKEDAVVFLQSHTGGSGVIITMAIVMNQDDKFKNTDCVDIGDNELVNSVKITTNKVTVDMLLHLSDEPHCCPESPLTFTFNISKKGRILNKTTFKNILDAGEEFALGHMMGMEKPDNKSITHYNKAIRLYPQYTLAYLYRAEALEELGRFSQAKRDYDAVLRLNPKSAEAYAGRAYCYLNLKQYDHAIKDITHTIEMEPVNADAYQLRASAYSHLLKYKEAIRDYSLSIEKFPKMKHEPCSQWQNMFEAAYFSRAQLYAHLKDYPKAIADLSTIINMVPPKEDKSFICFPEREKYEPLKSQAYLLRSQIYAELNNYSQAIKDVAINIKNDPQNESAYNARGSYYFEAEKYNWAIDDFTKALNLSKTSGRKLDNLICIATVYYQEKDFVKAKQYFQKALEIEPQLRQGKKILDKWHLGYPSKMSKGVLEMMRSAL